MRVLIVLLLPFQLFAQLKASTDGHYLIEQDGTPVFLNGISAWAINNLTYTEAQRFADSCATHEINYWQVQMMSPALFGGTANAYGVEPWQGGTQTFTATPNEPFWAHLDSVIGYAKTKDIYVMLYPAYLGATDSDGWKAQVGNSTLAAMYAWGEFVGNRYKDSTNVLWGIGGDTDPTTWQAKLDTMADAIAEVSTQLISTRDEPNTTSEAHWSGYNWVTLDYIYPYWSTYNPERIYQFARDIYNRIRKKPGGLEEAWYENEHGSRQAQLRQQAYYGVLGGAIAYQVYGNCPIWHFSQYSASLCGTGDWISELNSQGMINQKWAARLFKSRFWYKLVPDTSQAVMRAGYGTYGTSTYVTTAYASDGSSIIAYLPSQGSSVTVAPTVLAGDSVRVRWFNPSNGAVAFDSNQSTGNTFQVTPPAAGDWVLVVDSKNFDAIIDKPGGRVPQDISLSVEAEDLQQSKNFSPAQNYPNPFNPETTIVYSLPRSGFVELIVFNIDGKKVATLVSEPQQAGNYAVKFNAGALSSGLYFCKLRMADFVDTIKILVVK